MSFDALLNYILKNIQFQKEQNKKLIFKKESVM